MAPRVFLGLRQRSMRSIDSISIQSNGAYMTTAKIRLTFESDGEQPKTFEHELELTDLRTDGGMEFVAEHLFSEMEKESAFGKYFQTLPSPDEFLAPVKQSFRLEELASGAFEDRINTREMWLEIGNTLLRARHSLARSRAYYDQECRYALSQSSEAENLTWHFHLDKLECFDRAAMLLGKIGDLTARLIFERLGASLVLVDPQKDWERGILWKNIHRGLLDRTGNPHVASLTDAEYQGLLEIVDTYLRNDDAEKLWGYRSKVTHRLRPSVDRPELYTHLQSRERTPIKDQAGQIKGWTKGFGGIPKTPQYTFPELYENAVETLRHHISMLQRLKSIPRFSLEAAA